MYPPLRIKVLLRTPKGRVRALGRATDGEPPPRHMTRLRGLWTILGEVPDVEERDELALVATTIQVHFANVKARERARVELMPTRFRWLAARSCRTAFLSFVTRVRCRRDPFGSTKA